METISFPYVVAGMARSVEVPVVGEHVLAKAVVEALGVRWAKAKSEMEVVDLPEGSGVTLEALTAWLAGLNAYKSKLPEVIKHFQDHLAATLETKSVERVGALAKKALEEEKQRAKVITVDRPLTANDKFRADAARGVNRLAPEMINTTARIGAIDVFTRSRSMWDGIETIEHMNLITTAAGYRPGSWTEVKRSYPDLLTGPEFVKKFPDSPFAKRPIVPEHIVVREVDGQLRKVLIPEHPGLLPWEREISV